MTKARPPNKDRTAEHIDDLIRTQGPMLLHVINAIVGNIDISKQILQETYMNVWLRDSPADSIANLKAYMYAAAAQNAQKHRRAVQRHALSATEVVIDDEALNVHDTALDPANWTDQHELLEQLSSLIDELPEKQKKTFVLAIVEDVPRADIAAQFGVSLRAVEKSLTKARAALRSRLSALGVESTFGLRRRPKQ